MKILKNNEPILSQELPEFKFGEDVTAIACQMSDLMVASGGIGLAANQVGVTKRIIVLKTPKFKGVIVNPRVTRHTLGKIKSREGCLSYPGKQVDMMRHNKITVEGFDENWKPVKANVNGLSAFCIQHEIDHLDGITIGNQG